MRAQPLIHQGKPNNQRSRPENNQEDQRKRSVEAERSLPLPWMLDSRGDRGRGRPGKDIEEPRTDVYGDALKYERDFWPAEYQAGMLLLEKYNRPDAQAAFDKALSVNPHAAEALVGKGIAAFQQYELEDAERYVTRTLKINPYLPEALNLRADLYIAEGEIGRALETLERARNISPREETILGRIAACLELENRKDPLRLLIEQVERQDAKPGIFYLVFADQLAERRRFSEAEAGYKKAAQLWPALAAAQASLGLLYMRMGAKRKPGRCSSRRSNRIPSMCASRTP